MSSFLLCLALYAGPKELAVSCTPAHAVDLASYIRVLVAVQSGEVIQTRNGIVRVEVTF